VSIDESTNCKPWTYADMRPAIVEQSSLTPLGIVVSRGPFPMGLQFPVMSQSNPGADQPTDLQAVTGL
jgi:hypothetical protein